MIRKFIKKLLAPMVREVVTEIKMSENESAQLLQDAVQSTLIKALNQASLQI